MFIRRVSGSNVQVIISVFSYLCAVCTLHKLLNAPCEAYHAFRFKLMKRALSHTMFHVTDQKAAITPVMLQQLCDLTSHLGPSGLMFKCLFTLAFFSFLRCSNLVPRSGHSFDYSRHLCRGDILVQPDCLIIIIKWSKTKQTRDSIQYIAVSALPGCNVCPVSAFKKFQGQFPTSNNLPLFSYSLGKRQVVLSSPKVKNVLRLLLSVLGHDQNRYSMHSFRRGGCTTAYSCSADPLRLKQHGLWSSNAFERYITPDLREKLVVTELMSQAFAN